jgi:hypothetical protein
MRALDSSLAVGCLLAMFTLYPWSLFFSGVFACVACVLAARLHIDSVRAGLREQRED